MTPTLGSMIEWRRANGKMNRMVVDLIHRDGDDIWLFGWWGTSWAAVKQTVVLGVRK